MKKKLLSLLLVLVMLLTAFPVTAFAASRDFEPGDTGTATMNKAMWVLDTPESGRKSIEHLTIGNKVTVLEAYIELDKAYYAHKIKTAKGTVGFLRFSKAQGSPLTTTLITGKVAVPYVEERAKQLEEEAAKQAEKDAEKAAQKAEEEAAKQAAEELNARLYPHPIDMSVLSDYIYDGSKSCTGKAIRTHSIKLPEDWVLHQRPDDLPCVGSATLHIGDAGKSGIVGISFYPGNPPVNYHQKVIEELYALSYEPKMGPISTGKAYANTAFYAYTESTFEIVAYDDKWVAVWSNGGIDPSFGLGNPCGGVQYAQFAWWKPGVYFVPRSNCYIEEYNNYYYKPPMAAATGTATSGLLIKTTPDKDDYVKSGVFSIGDQFLVLDTTPIGGHYKIYFRGGAYYVNAQYVNLKIAGVTKPTIAYKATVKSDSTINIRAKTSINSDLIASVKNGTVLEVLKKNYNDTYSQIWFNSKVCYIQTKYLTSFKTVTSAADISKLGAPIGVIAVDSPWRAYGARAYTAEGLKLFKENNLRSTKATVARSVVLKENDWANVYKVSKYTYTPNPKFPKNTKTATIYTVEVGGEIRYVVGATSIPFTYYTGTKYKLKAKSDSYSLTFNKQKYTLTTYKINKENYFRLNDIAKLFATTAKCFDFEVDESAHAIHLTSMKKYKGKATLKGGDGVKRTVYATPYFMTFDGDPIGMTCYTIKGEYYVKLGDITHLLNCYTVTRYSDILSVLTTYEEYKGAAG